MTDAPSKDDLLKTTAVAGILAVAALVFAVLPAEYGIDPTGFGRAVGLVDADAPTIEGRDPFVPANTTLRETAQTIELPDSGAWREYKLDMPAGATIVFSWNATHPVVHDLHHDDFGSFDTGEASSRTGSFTAPEAGLYGWAFRSPTADATTVTLTVSGHWR